MQINFSTKKLKKIFEDITALKKKYGDRQSKKIVQRMYELEVAKNLQDIKSNPSARLHYLKGKYAECLAIDLINPYRLIVKPEDGVKGDYKTITIIEIINVEDYH